MHNNSHGFYRDFSSSKLWRPPIKKGPTTSLTIFLFLFLLVAVWIASSWINSSVVVVTENQTKSHHHHRVIVTKQILTNEAPKKKKRVHQFPLNCSSSNATQTCSSNYPTKINNVHELVFHNNVTCPEYFRWIHQDLRPFKASGITREMVERAKKTAHFRLVIKKGKAYVESYKKSIQTRDAFTLWGILQLLRRYPGMLPDLELMFDCNDRPVVHRRDYRGPNATAPPPVFRYCGDPWTLDIVFPDWSFWGWAEINIRPWDKMLKEIKRGNKKIKWVDREPYAYWKGNPYVAETRQDLLKCNVSQQQDWNARLFIQDWVREYEQGYKHSSVADQCTYRYKIYIEGYAWSVSEKYILGCNSPTLLVNTKFHDFFLRSLQPLKHYWPVKQEDKCKSIKFAVDWGNSHQQKAQEIGRAASEFVQNDLKMEFIYDYMFHLMNEYAKLLKYEPEIPENAVELCAEKMVCHAEDGPGKRFMIESLVKSPSERSPCGLPPPYGVRDLGAVIREKANSFSQVDTWEKNLYENFTMAAARK
ncbi:OLC1v1029650C1 [Oldenlandia corymbosa var. corymbosa]|uniref:OLC1v1029650C1 n=1 Tax=Oldenlandia corymbosa var. corymbosa TaxID=529605 RepID=A0AAV1CEA5_OLDCO|nr:OLC1v1029650C1 [Oldenlandia corymbosa var. corymbosa]